MAIRVVVSGTGRMGRQVLDALDAAPDLEPVGVIEAQRPEAELALPSGRSVPMRADPRAALAELRPDVVVDFTVADWTPVVARAAVEAGARPVIGTTGLDETFLDELDRLARERGLGAVVAPNFAIGAVLLIHMARLASRYFDHAEIIELHHEQKIDAPSGTALATAREMLAARGRPFERPRTEKEPLPGTRGGELEGIAIHSVRLPGLVAHQEVLFGGLGQTLTLRHDSTGRESFMPGVLLACREVMRRVGLVRGLDALIGLADGPRPPQ
jgi:4-hydroxy-tetrahydrodipicolinate reductase